MKSVVGGVVALVFAVSSMIHWKSSEVSTSPIQVAALDPTAAALGNLLRARDAELIALEHAVEEKDALELGNIAPTLSAIAGNQEMMQRVRIRATKLLEQSAGAGSASK